MRGERAQQRPVRWQEAHPEAFAELKRLYGVIGHSSVLMVLSMSLIGTTLTVGFLNLPGWMESAVRLAASLGAVGCGALALWRVLRAMWRTVRAVFRTRRRSPQHP
ncbi:hypothetical protein ACFY1P_20045 [Streptomyces sp. NPDC001407]|uniref:hypothetical protein n=1 Tax=Streptomyces sp. NPDC001407 TaxID=3364573 RepID=UPI003682F67C